MERRLTSEQNKSLKNPDGPVDGLVETPTIRKIALSIYADIPIFNIFAMGVLLGA